MHMLFKIYTLPISAKGSARHARISGCRRTTIRLGRYCLGVSQVSRKKRIPFGTYKHTSIAMPP